MDRRLEGGKKLCETINFRLARKSDLSQIVDLTNSQYSRKKDESYFLWQYFDSYYPTILMCAFNNTKLIGTFGLQKRKLNNGAHVGQATDLLVAPEWRKKGIFKSLGKKAISYFRDLDLLCSFTNLNGKIACEKAFNWKTVSRINSMCLQVKDYENLLLEPLRALNQDTKIYKFVRFCYTDKTRLWRYNKHPDYRYTYVELSDEVFAVTKLFKDPVTGILYGDIVDFECELNHPTQLRELFLKASIHLKKQGVEYITTWALPYTPLRKVIESLGFVEITQERYFCLKVLNPKYENLYNISYWHLIQADSEIY
jgi:GNAT superfamily N-acetyltransferase